MTGFSLPAVPWGAVSLHGFTKSRRLSPEPGGAEGLGGWGTRPYDWQFGASIQHEILPRVSAEVGYNRRWWGNFFVTDNTLVGPEDYDTYAIAIPQHPNLPGEAAERRATWPSPRRARSAVRRTT